MTVTELSKLYWLNREVEKNKRQLERLETELQEDIRLLRDLKKVMGEVSSPPITDMPKAPCVGSPTENKVMRILQLENNIARKRDTIMDIRVIISARQTLCLLERKRLEEYISHIADSLTRQIFTLRFIDGLTWEQVAGAIGGKAKTTDANKAETVRKTCYRYLHSGTA